MRLLKQIIYGGAMVILAMGIIWLIGSIIGSMPPTCLDNIKNQGETNIDCGGPCAPCEIKSRIVISEKEIFPHYQIGRTSFYISFSNSSAEYWASSFKYELRVYDRFNVLIDIIDGQSSLPPAAVTNQGLDPGQARVILFATRVVPIDAASIAVKVTQENWRPASTYIDPLLSVEDIRFTGSYERLIIAGVIRNASSIEVTDSIVGAVFRNSEGKAIGISSSAIGAILPFSEKNFEIFWRSEGAGILDMQNTEIFIKNQ